MKRYGLWLATFWIAITAVAQTTTSTQPLTVKSERVEILVGEKQVRVFSANDYDSLVVLPDYGLKVYVKNQPSVDYLNATYKVLPQESGPVVADDTNVNKNVKLYDRNQYAWRLEYPRTKDDADNILSVHKLKGTEDITLSIEWDCKKKSQRWTCYQFHNGYSVNVSRTDGDPWQDDPNIPAEYQTHTKDYRSNGRNFDRGHMCNSLDRLHSEEQNRQTFYISNAHPQYGGHNRGIWKRLEAKVNEWGNNKSFRDTLYVVKAGTIDNGNVLEPLKSTQSDAEILVPKYMYMAILCRQGNTYKAIAFWTEHKDESLGSVPLKDFAKSIDDLEKLTGIDFFCNLPDNIEDQVEKTLKLEDWTW